MKSFIERPFSVGGGGHLGAAGTLSNSPEINYHLQLPLRSAGMLNELLLLMFLGLGSKLLLFVYSDGQVRINRNLFACIWTADQRHSSSAAQIMEVPLDRGLNIHGLGLRFTRRCRYRISSFPPCVDFSGFTCCANLPLGCLFKGQ